jgi:hypothetical protein
MDGVLRNYTNKFLTMKTLLLIIIMLLAGCSGVRHSGAPYYSRSHRYVNPKIKTNTPSLHWKYHCNYMRNCVEIYDRKTMQ